MSKQEIKKIHNNTDFKIEFAGITQLGEFRYEHGGTVQPGLEYHIHYMNNKREVYMTEGSHTNSSKIIRKVGGKKTLFKQYTNIKVSPKGKYPEITPAYPSETDYELGSFTKYFTQKANDSNALIFEISNNDFENKNNLFKFIKFDWVIYGTKEEVSRYNQAVINDVNKKLPGISRNLFPLQYWRPPKGSPDDLQKKLVLLRNS